jgi:hypothetical protein
VRLGAMTIRCTPAWWAAGCWSPPDPDRVRVWCEATWSPTIYGLGRHQTITDPAHVRAAEALRQQRFALVRPAAETEVEQRQSSDSDVESRQPARIRRPGLAKRARREARTHEEYLPACPQREVAARDAQGGEDWIGTARFRPRKVSRSSTLTTPLA